MAAKFKKHPTALVETDKVGAGTRVWAHVHILPGAVVGKNCNLCDQVFLEGGARLGDGVTVKNGTQIWNGVTIENYVFVGPGVVFTNDLYPRSAKNPLLAAQQAKGDWLIKTRVREGAAIGANATIIGGVTVGRYALVGAGAVVTRDVGDYGVVFGNPARPAGHVCLCGNLLRKKVPGTCSRCGRSYARRGSKVVLVPRPGRKTP